MKRFIAFLCLFFALIQPAHAVRVKQYMKTTIGLFDACEQTLTYSFFKDHDYDVKTTLTTTGTFGALYPFNGLYHAVGTYDKNLFVPQDYFQEAKSRFHHRTKELIFENGVPKYRVSTKDEKKRRDEVVLNEEYGQSLDFLSTLGVILEQINRKGNCDFKGYSFSGKHYSLSNVKTAGKEKIKTDYFEGKALKCKYNLENVDEDEAGFLLSNGEPVYIWLLKDKKSDAYYVARIVVESTPFGKLESLTTKIEVTK